jgi:hypothetical protein
MRVEVYFNLHKKTFSVRNCKTGLVIAHTDNIWVEDPVFVVRKAGREKVLRERKKNVHAFVRGTWMQDLLVEPEHQDYLEHREWAEEVTYNPYKYDSFVTKHDAKAIDFGRLASLTCSSANNTRSIYVS